MCKMDILKDILPPKIFVIIDRAGLCTPKQIRILSIWDIKKLTGLQRVDIELLKNIVAKHCSPQSVTCDQLIDRKDDKIKIGCTAIDNLLNGGFRKGVLVEIYGESGSGKTQLGMQLSANNASEGSVYICTEDLFPITRYNQIHSHICEHNSQLGNNMFLEHVYEAPDLLSCIRVRLPKLLQQHRISVVVIDSVAAPFRCETTNYVQRAEDLRELAMMLIGIAQEYNLTVVCINQVTASFDDSTTKLLPSLGLAWSNMISYRFWIKKAISEKNLLDGKQNVREMKTVFAPDLPNDSCNFMITERGITNL
ncbi:DNA repair protein XRCC3 [Epargyreus clarus]|uniref:DNA repair protein XRCC3 n=1 Tax=Epargyreus clarus TaxID=520877 RepID=UPI003C2BB7F0